jgi:hypothetical protein
MTARQQKTESLWVKLGGNAPEVPRTLPQKSERSSTLICKSVAPQGASERADLATASATLDSPEIDGKVRRELVVNGRGRSRPLGVVIIDTISVPRSVLCERGISALVDDRFSVALLPLQSLATAIRQYASEESAELADATATLLNAAVTGFVPAVVYVGRALVVFGGRWPMPRPGGQ